MSTEETDFRERGRGDYSIHLSTYFFFIGKLLLWNPGWFQIQLPLWATMANTGINNFKADDFRKASLYSCYTIYKVSEKELHGLPVLNAWDRQGYVCATKRLSVCTVS